MDLNNFRKRKEAGHVVIKKLGKAFAMERTVYDPETGDELAPDVTGFNREMIEERRALVASQLEELDAFLAHLDEVEGKPTKKPAAK